MIDKPILLASVLWTVFQLPSSIGDLEPIFDQCCKFGVSWAKQRFDCSSYPVPVGNVAAGDQSICQSLIEICCIRTQREKNCENGKESAKQGRVCTVLTTLGGEAHKDCCDACKLGLISSGLQMPCTFSNFAFGSPWGEAYHDCCLQTLSNDKPDNPSPNADDQDECMMFPGRLCAHICINTPGSYRCECYTGFKLHSNGKACVQVAEENRCNANNPCEQECIDTGTAIQCGCFPGYQLLSDRRSCGDIDECVLGTDNCNRNTQICHNTLGGFQCLDKNSPNNETASGKKCPPGYYLRLDTETCNDIDECTVGTDSCDRSTEICSNTVGSYACIRHSGQQCPPGFKRDAGGTGCIDVDECDEGLDNCNQESEVCVNTHGGYNCEPKDVAKCPAGFKWNNDFAHCVDIDECAEGSHNCNLHTHTCVNQPSSFLCVPKGSECGHGFQRNIFTNQCEDVNECAIGTHDCNLDSQYCVNTEGSFQCQTKAQYCGIGYGIDIVTHKCVDMDECEEGIECPANQICENTVGSYRCHCKEGFETDLATTACKDINECQTGHHKCLPSQRCDNTIGSYSCVRIVSCGTGYTLNAETSECEDDDECRIGNHNCGPGFVCRNTMGSFRCDRITCPPRQKLLSDGTCQMVICPRGMEADVNGVCIDINECVNAGICRPNQRCINTRGSYRCQNLLSCGVGYELNEFGNQCVDIDECAQGTHQCGADQICRNRPGGYLCECPAGHTMNAQRECVDIDECVRYRGQVCSVNSECQNTVGSYICNCKPGFRQEEDGRNCVDVDECSETPNLCHHKCINVWGTYQCQCDQGYQLQEDNRSCKDIDECALWEGKRRLCVGFCVNEPGSYSCSCPDGYRLSPNKRDCIDINECEQRNACQGENEVCLNTRGGFRCNSIVCPPNYIRDPDHRKIQEDTFICKKRCKSNDIDCVLNNTQTITYQAIAIPSIPVLPRPIILTTMRALSRNRGITFDSDYIILEGNNEHYFDILRGDGVGSLRLVEPIRGPVELDLKLSMQIILHHHTPTTRSPLSRHLAFVKILVSQYDF